MTDRAGDADVMLDELDVPEEKRLKCNAHVLLAVDVALDKAFQDVETKVGEANLIDKGVSCFQLAKEQCVVFGSYCFGETTISIS